MINWELIISFLRLFLELSLLVKISSDYWKLRYPTLRFLLVSIILFLLSEIQRMLSSLPVPSGNTVFKRIFLSALSLITLIWAFYFILLFFQSFLSENVFTVRNTFLAIFATVFSSVLFISVLLLRLNPRVFQILVTENTSDPLLYSLVFDLIIVTAITLFFSIILIVVLTFFMFRHLHSKWKQARDPIIRRLLRNMEIGTFFMFLGPFLTVLIGSQMIGDILSLIGFTVITIVFLLSGIYALQGEGLKRILIMDVNGLPIYSYIFREFSEEEGEKEEGHSLDSLQSLEDQDILFSGALKAISAMLAEMTGAKRMIQEIVLDNVVLIVREVPNKPYYVILFADRSTMFYRKALEKLAMDLFEIIGEVKRSQSLSTEQIKIANQLVQLLFVQQYPFKLARIKDEIQHKIETAKKRRKTGE